ncbi:nuclear transport factor 2 family protein [Brevibacillus sp. NRS-1366]|uniref:nuclear transport factor 2 family protein n=1 Tax=Brevibacillus sp. NRS-1366 TaxID=3233899 RepID=UPI003D1DDA43
MIQKSEVTSHIHQAVIDTIIRFATALDTNNWELYRSCFSDTVEVDYSDALGLPSTKVNADVWTSFARACCDPIQTFHVYTNFSVELNGDVAFVRNYHTSRHRRPNTTGGDQYTQYGWYETTLKNSEKGWVISSLRHRIQWCDGNPLVVDSTTDDYKQAEASVFGTKESSL